MDEIEFTRLTCRVISHLGDLLKLATSPLIHLPAVVSVSAGNLLNRSHALKSLLTESVRRLKPQVDKEFGTTEE
jgi:hypothetical protein